MNMTRLTLVLILFLFNGLVFANDTFIKNMKVIEDTEDHQIKLSFDYSYSGKQGNEVVLVIAALNSKQDDTKPKFQKIEKIQVGKGNKEIVFSKYRNSKEYITDQIQFNYIIKGETYPFYSNTLDFVKSWKQNEKEESSETRNTRLLSESIKLIDDGRVGGERIQLAKKNLEKVLLDDPENKQAYLEMARVKMKEDPAIRGHSNSNGVTQAKRLIETALEIDNKYANSYILLGYVNALEGDKEEAVQNLEKAKAIGSKNMWLYSNWGLALEKSNDNKAAIEIYKEAIALPLDEYVNDYSLKSSNRAIPQIFRHLITLLYESNDWDEVNKTYERQVSILNDGCSFSQYASFRLHQYGDYEKAIKLSEDSLNKRECQQFTRANLVSAYLLKVANDSNLSKKESSILYNKSITLMTNPVELITDLAGSKQTWPAVEVLSEKGTSIDSKDTRNFTPLAYAIYRNNNTSAEVLLNHGAKIDILVTENELTYLMLAVANQNENLVKLLLEKGADVNVRSKDGYTALSIAKEIDLPNISKLLSTSKGI